MLVVLIPPYSLDLGGGMGAAAMFQYPAGETHYCPITSCWIFLRSNVAITSAIASLSLQLFCPW